MILSYPRVKGQQVTIGPKFRAGREIEAKTFGRHLQALRHHLLLNDKRLADRLGISPNAVRNWESGASLPSNENVEKVLAIAGNEADPDWLLSGRGTIPEWVKQNHIEISSVFHLETNEDKPAPDSATKESSSSFISSLPPRYRSAPIVIVNDEDGRIVIDADAKLYRLEFVDGGVKVVRI